MKQTINIGNVVDDGTGDYLRQAGEKMNSNFDEAYGLLGDGQMFHPAGAFQTHTRQSDGAALTVKFGEAWNIDTSTGSVTVTLPSVTVADIGKTITLRDAHGKWNLNTVDVTSPDGSIKGSQTIELRNQYQEAKFVYVGNLRWEYAPQRKINSYSFSDVPSVVRHALLMTDGQRDVDFYALMGGEYNTLSVEIYRRGNLMYYGPEGLNDASDYGSVPDATKPLWTASTQYDEGAIVRRPNPTYNSGAPLDHTNWEFDYFRSKAAFTSGASFDPSRWDQINNGDLVALDGRTIRLRLAADVGDPLALVTYLSDVSSFRTSYSSRNVMIIGQNSDTTPSDGNIIQLNLDTDKTITLQTMGFSAGTEANPDSFECLVNGKQLVPANQAGQASSGGDQEFDFELLQDETGKYNTVTFYRNFEEKDIVTVRWFDNVIGTTLAWDEGEDNIQGRADARYLQSINTVELTNTIRYTDTDNPSAPSAEVVPGTQTGRWESALDLLMSIYPVGSIYLNANNPANPNDYMGFGKWVRFGEGKALTGWQDADSQGQYDPDFGYNNQWIVDGQPQPAAGGIGGVKSVVLTTANIPPLQSGLDEEGNRDPNQAAEQYALVARPAGGDINLSGCQPDPTAGAPVLSSYAEEPIRVNTGNNPTSVSVLQPYITIHAWVRTE